MYFRLGRTRKYVKKSNEEPDCESLNDHMENCSLKPDNSSQKTLKSAMMALRDSKEAAREGTNGIREKIVKHFGKKKLTQKSQEYQTYKPLLLTKYNLGWSQEMRYKTSVFFAGVLYNLKS